MSASKSEAAAATPSPPLSSPGFQTRRRAFAAHSPPLPRRPEVLSSVDPVDAWLYFSSRASTWRPLVSPSPAEQQRTNVANEIVATERDYVRDLAFVALHYSLPLREVMREGGLEVEFSALFANWESILAVNFEILRRVEDGGGTPESIGLAFATLADFLKCYRSYCATQSIRIDALREVIRKSPEVREFTAQVKSLPESRQLDLDSFLMRPVQRITKYPLLLRELRKCTAATAATVATVTTLDSAIDKVQMIVDSINAEARKQENQVMVAKIQERVVGEKRGVLVTPSRRFIKEAPAFDLVSKSEVNLVLFNNLLLVTSATSLTGRKKLKILEWIDLPECLVEFEPESAPSSASPAPPSSPSPAPPAALTEQATSFTIRSSAMSKEFRFLDNGHAGWRDSLSEVVFNTRSAFSSPWFRESPPASAPSEPVVTFCREPGCFKLFYWFENATHENIIRRHRNGFCCPGFALMSTPPTKDGDPACPIVFRTLADLIAELKERLLHPRQDEATRPVIGLRVISVDDAVILPSKEVSKRLMVPTTSRSLPLLPEPPISLQLSRDGQEKKKKL